MSLLDRFRTSPLKSGDPAARAAAVRQLGPEEQPQFAEIARADPDALVRRAAASRLTDVAVLAEVARTDADDAVRETAAGLLLRRARSESDPALGRAALAGLSQARHLAEVARESPVAEVRAEAVGRLDNGRALAAVARTATHADARLLAVERLHDAALLGELALKCEYKDTALAAVEKLDDRAALEAVAARGRSRAAVRRAQAKLDALPRPEPAPATAGAESAPGDAVPAPAPAAASEAAVPAVLAPEPPPLANEDLAARVALSQTVEELEGEDAPTALAEAERAWERLPPAEGVEAEALARRFTDGVAAARRRYDAWFASRDRRARMDALCTELEELADHPDLRVVSERWSVLRKDWAGLQSMDQVDEDTRARYARAVARIEARQAEARVARDKEAGQNLARLQALAARVEALAGEPPPRLADAQRALRESRDALREPPRLPTKKDRDTLLARLKAGRAALYPRVQELKQADEWKRWANLAVQEELSKRMEELATLEDIPRATRELRELEERWKQASQAPRDQAEAMWTRFKAARSAVRARGKAHFAAEAAQRAENLKKKEALLAEAESLAESTDWVKTAERLQALQTEWQAIGSVPRQQARPLWERFRAACGRFFERRKADRSRRAVARKENLDKKEALLGQAEALAASTDWEKAQAEVRRLQAEWKTTGPVRKDRSEELWQRFRKACDQVFDRYRHRDEIESEGKLAAREAACAQVEALAPSEPGATPPEDLSARLRALQVAMKDGGRIPGPRAEALDHRFQEAVQRLVAAWPDVFRGTDLDPGANRKKLEKLCETVEALAAERPARDATVSPAELLARQLREALANNTMRGRVDEGAKRRELKEKVAAAQAAYNRLGPVPGEEGRALRQRFQDACRRLLTA
ncbi:MAG TPA: DUF349 domain-containing protein [Vicinamibacteria bacterium]